MFRRWGAFTYRFRRPIVVLAILLAVASTFLAAQVTGSLSAGGWTDPNSESAAVADRLAGRVRGLRRLDRRGLPGRRRRGRPLAGVPGHHHRRRSTGSSPTTASTARSAGRRPATTGSSARTARDAYIVVRLAITDEAAVDEMHDLRELIDQPTGPDPAPDRRRRRRPRTRPSSPRRSWSRRRRCRCPFAALILILVFASLVAAGMPLVVAVLAIPTTLAGVYLAAQVTELSIYVQNVATMLGLALAIDYSLFMVSRFREELRARPRRRHRRRDHRRHERQGRHVLRPGRRRRPVRPAPVRAGRAALVRHRWRADRGRLRALRPDLPAGRPGHARPTGQRRRGGRPARPGPARLRPPGRGRRGRRARVALGADGPLGHGPAGRRAHPDPRLPAPAGHAVPAPRAGHPGRVDPARRASRAARPRSPCPRDFRAGETSPIIVLADVERLPHRRGQRPAHPRPRAPPSTPSRASTGSRGRSPTCVDPATGAELDAAGIAALFAAPRDQLPPELAAGLEQLEDGLPPRLDRPPRRDQPARARSARTGRRSCRPCARSPSTASRPRSAVWPPTGHDFMTSQAETVPYAIGLTLGASALILFLLFGSVVIPIKAVIMTLLSITASFGALVFIFQEGNFSASSGSPRPGSPWPAIRSSCSASCSACRWTTRSCSCRASRRPIDGPATTPHRWRRAWPRRPASSPAPR